MTQNPRRRLWAALKLPTWLRTLWREIREPDLPWELPRYRLDVVDGRTTLEVDPANTTVVNFRRKKDDGNGMAA